MTTDVPERRVLCDCCRCFKRLRYMKHRGTPERHLDGKHRCPGSEMPPRWISDDSVDLKKLRTEYLERVKADGD